MCSARKCFILVEIAQHINNVSFVVEPSVRDDETTRLFNLNNVDNIPPEGKPTQSPDKIMQQIGRVPKGATTSGQRHV